MILIYTKGMDEMEYTLKNVTEADKMFIYQLKKKSNFKYVDKIWGWDEEYQVKDFASDFNIEDFKLIQSEGVAIGFIQTNENVDNINITEIHIIDDYQGKGIGSDIIQNILDTGKRVTLGCFKDNVAARKLYERLGFKVIKQTTTHYMLECLSK